MISTFFSLSLAAIGILLLITGPNDLPLIVAAVICFISAVIIVSGAEFPKKRS